MPVVPNFEGGGRRVVADLLTDQLCRARIVVPFAEKNLAEEGIQRLELLPLSIIILGGVLVLQCANKPLQDQECPLLRVLLLRRQDEEARVFCPVGAVLDDRLWGK